MIQARRSRTLSLKTWHTHKCDRSENQWWNVAFEVKKLLSFAIAEEHMLPEICCRSLTHKHAIVKKIKNEEMRTFECGPNKPQTQYLTRMGRAMNMRTKSLTRVDKIRTQNSARAGSELRTTSLHGPGRTNWNCGLRAEHAANSNQNLWHERGPNKIGTQPFAQTAEVSEPRTDFLASAWSFTVQPLPFSFQALLFGSRTYSPRRFTVWPLTLYCLAIDHHGDDHVMSICFSF